MGAKEFFYSLIGKSKVDIQPKTFFDTNSRSLGTYNNVFRISYDGEKNLGEIGPIRDYRLDYEGLRLRSWQAYLESEIAQFVLNKFVSWVIGSGLKLQSEPNTIVLESEQINFDTHAFSELVEARFSAYCNSKTSDYAGMENIHLIAEKAYLNAIIGGDVLCILRYIDDNTTIQLIDGSHIVSPMIGNDFFVNAEKNGNRIISGIEISPSGEHVAYFIRKDAFEVERVLAKGPESGLTMAFLVYGLRYRLDNHRGIPLISAVLETLKKLERYKEATVGSAEEVAKVAYQIVHQIFSNGENVLINNVARAFDTDSKKTDIPIDEQGKILANLVAATTNKQAFNMPIGSEIKTLENKGPLHFKDFYGVNIDLVCAAIEIPPNVAQSKYNDSFSASRAAIKDWEHTLNVKRKKFSFQFYSPIYAFWLQTEILKNKIQAPGFLIAKAKNNHLVISAYLNARWVGANVPHIDPVKEVNAERLKLGITGAGIPLTTVEAATEALNGGESDANMQQYSKELEKSKSLKIMVEPTPIKEP
jgi:capsid protein